MNEFYTKYNRGKRPSICFQNPTKTEQHHKNDCDINTILNRCARGLTASVTPIREGFYADVTSAPSSFQELHQRVADGKEYFDTLPAELRERFNNAPSNFFDWVGDPANEEEAVSLGILPKKTAPIEPDPALHPPINTEKVEKETTDEVVKS